MRKSNKLALFALVVVLILYGFFLLHEANLVTADLGRHIRNGEMILSGQDGIFTTNFYSYTQPDFPFVNHHWGSGVIFYAIWKIAGFAGLHLFFIILSLLSLAIIFWFSQRRAGLGITSIASLLAMPLIVERIEIRPEVFSYLFAVIFFVLLWRYKEGKIPFKKLLIILVLLEILWVNLHIYFVLGIALIGAFLVADLLRKKWPEAKKSGILLFATAIATLFTPLGLKGTFALRNVFESYGYRLVENQSVWFIEKLISNPNFIAIKILSILLLFSFIAVLIYRKNKFNLTNLLIMIGFTGMAWLAIRNFTLFGLFLIPTLSLNIKSPYLEVGLPSKFNKWIIGVVTVLVLFILIGGFKPLFPQRGGNLGLGLAENNSASVDFIKENNIEGPIFNNYDIGGYLIFHLFPQEKVFVDNRPEAYSVSHFQDTYIPAQEDNTEWAKLLEKEKFNVIIFYHRDATPWGQSFLISRIQDSEWAPVFADNNVIVFLHRTINNFEIIEQYELSQDNFQILR